MKNIKLVLEYDGSRYQGWMRLGKGESNNTILNKLEDILFKMEGKGVEIQTGCRTEVGVHASGQVVSFKVDTDLSVMEIKNYLNRYLPHDIAVVYAEEMEDRFHASLNAKSKTYLYRVATRKAPSVFERKYVYHSFKSLDVDAMREAGLALIGKHDFKYFTTAKRSKSTEKTILDLDIYGNENEVTIQIKANDFLHNMPRLLIALLLEIGYGNRPVSEMSRMLGESCAYDPFPPCDPVGLKLEEVSFEL